MESTTTLESPATAPASHHVPAHRPHAAKHPRKPRSRWRAALSLVLGLALAGWLGLKGMHAYHFVETDDAFVTGHIHQVSPQVEARVAEVLVTDNQAVQAGDVLVRLDPLQFELAVEKARAASAQARAQAAETKAAASQAEAQLAEARARHQQAEAQLAQTAAQLDLARLNLTRNEQLFAKGGVITQADLDTVRGAYQAAEAAHAANQANLAAAQSAIGSVEAARNSAEAQVAAADAAIGVAEAAARDAERELGYATITAPAAGRIGNKAVEAGNRVVAGQTLFSLAAPEPWIVANFKETQLARVTPGQEVELTVDALPGRELHGKVDSIAPASGSQFALLPADNATGNFNKVVQRVPVKIILDEASRRELGDRLRLGLSAIVNIRVR